MAFKNRKLRERFIAQERPYQAVCIIDNPGPEWDPPGEGEGIVVDREWVKRARALSQNIRYLAQYRDEPVEDNKNEAVGD